MGAEASTLQAERVFGERGALGAEWVRVPGGGAPTLRAERGFRGKGARWGQSGCQEAALDNNGVSHASISDVIDTGKQVCRIVRTYGTAQSVWMAAEMRGRAGYDSGAERAIIVKAAAANMCPDIIPQLQAFADAVSSDRGRQV